MFSNQPVVCHVSVQQISGSLAGKGWVPLLLYCALIRAKFLLYMAPGNSRELVERQSAILDMAGRKYASFWINGCCGGWGKGLKWSKHRQKTDWRKWGAQQKGKPTVQRKNVMGKVEFLARECIEESWRGVCGHEFSSLARFQGPKAYDKCPNWAA